MPVLHGRCDGCRKSKASPKTIDHGSWMGSTSFFPVCLAGEPLTSTSCCILVARLVSFCFLVSSYYCYYCGPFLYVAWKHQWSSGRIVPCHGTDQGSIPGWCIIFFVLWYLSFVLTSNKKRMLIIKETKSCSSQKHPKVYIWWQ